ncbi:MAG: hypothetical protein ABI743_09235 [bacterium]
MSHERIPGLDSTEEPPEEVVRGPMRLVAYTLAWILMGVVVTVLLLLLSGAWGEGLSCSNIT